MITVKIQPLEYFFLSKITNFNETLALMLFSFENLVLNIAIFYNSLEA